MQMYELNDEFYQSKNYDESFYGEEYERNEENETILKEEENDCHLNKPTKEEQKLKEENNDIQKTDIETKKQEFQQNLEQEKTIAPKEEIINFKIDKGDIDILKNDLTPVLKKKRGRPKEGNNEVEHNRFSDDNLRRKCKHIVLQNTMDFINNKISDLYGNISRGINIKKLLIINQRQITNATISFNKNFLDKTLGEIFSEKISSRYTNYMKDHNEALIKKLTQDDDEIKRNYFQKLFNIKFIECLKHFRRSCKIPELEGLTTFQKPESKNEIDEDYWKTLNYYIKNYEEITNRKKGRIKQEILFNNNI